MIFSPLNNEICILPACYRPMTVMLVDDDPDFLEQLSQQLSEYLPVITFTNPDEAIQYFETQNLALQKWMSGKNKGAPEIIKHSRQEPHNKDRFKGILVSVVDYEMPDKNGFDIMKTMGEPILSEMSFHSYILFTGKQFSDFDERLAALAVGKHFISKWAPDRIEQLLKSIISHSTQTFQWMSYTIARTLSTDPSEKTGILFDGNFLDIFNSHINKNNICELYLFDRQGSYLFLDEHAKLSWMFVRNDLGMENSVELAKKYHAPSWVIDALLSKEKLLSLYEETDVKQLSHIDWETCLLDTNIFKSDERYTKFFKLPHQSQCYYAFTNHFPPYSNLNSRP